MISCSDSTGPVTREVEKESCSPLYLVNHQTGDTVSVGSICITVYKK